MSSAPMSATMKPGNVVLFASAFATLGLIACFAFLISRSFAQTLTPGEVRISSRPYHPQSQGLRRESRLVQIEVVIRDINGRAVGGLTRDNFVVLDSGHLRDIDEFSVENSSEPALSSAKPQSAASPATSPAQPAPVQPSTPEAAPYVPRWILLFFDDINTLPGDLAHAKIAAKRFIKEAGISGDRIAVFTSSGGQILDFTHSTDAVLEATSQVESHPRISPGGVAPCPRITAYEAYQIVNNDPNALEAKVAEACQCTGAQTCPASFSGGNVSLTGSPSTSPYPTLLPNVVEAVRSQAQATWAQARTSSQATLDAVKASITRLALMPGKRLLLLASSGFFTFDLDETKDQIVNEAVHAGVVINSIDSKGLYADAPVGPINETVETVTLPNETLLYETQSLGDRLDSEDSAMARLAESTGGLLYRNNNDLDYGFRELGLVPAYAYELGISPDEDGKYHTIKVKLNNVKHDFIQARPGYFAPTKAVSTPTASDKVDAEMLGSDERSDFPVTVRGAPGNDKSGAKDISVDARVDISKLPFEKQKDRRDEKLTFIAGLFDPQGKFITGKEAEMELALKQDSFERFSKSGITGAMSLEAPPGNYRLRVVVQEAAMGEMSATTQNVEIR